MESFIIQPNRFLSRDIQAFYHADFYGYGKQNNPDYLNILKNDSHQNWHDNHLKYAVKQLRKVLIDDLFQIPHKVQLNMPTACVIPRAKADNTYNVNQMLFKSTVQSVVNRSTVFVDGTKYIGRHTNTKTTHLRRPIEGYVNDGRSPYPGITNNTCDILDKVGGEDILLIDDIYTKTVNVVEDAIQALLDRGAVSVTFYAVGRTVDRRPY